VVFVAEQFAPPIVDGSTYVYKNWIDFLAARFDLYAIFFTSYAGAPTQAHAYLAERCKAHLILPGTPASRWWKIARAGARFLTGNTFAPRWIEEFGRSGIHRTIADFVHRHEPDLFIVSKLVSVPLFGEANIRSLPGRFVLDMHDDFVQRDDLERRVLRRLLRRFPEMSAYPAFRNMVFRQRLSRLNAPAARRQEARLCGLFDRVLASSTEEFRFYRGHLGGTSCEFLGWPPPLRGPEIAMAPAPAPRFDAGFIGGNHPFNVEALAFFLDDVLPRVRLRHPDFSLLVAGKAGAPFALQGRTWPGVEFVGYVPDAASFYAQVRMCVVPIRSGTGVSLKTLEALELGKPVIATRAGVRGLDGIEAHPNLLRADSAADFVERILSVLDGKTAVSSVVAARSTPDAFANRFDRLVRTLERGTRADAVAVAPLPVRS
jgi:glycosyltransferase involved in cell wall biosynthesis